ncbi:MAG TPA: urease accessory protein UreD [Micropepsaceae bacterium]|nr:urease accessory protein UreD [Micropepsaceae bacterium]
MTLTSVARQIRLQRSFGTADLVFAQRNGISEPIRVFQHGALKVRFPRADPGQPPEAVLLNLAGGLTGGDRVEFAIRLEERSSAVLTTQSCERIYRSPADAALVQNQICLGPGACMEWLPQPTIFFDGACLKRETHVELSADASLLALEALIFGRTARGETVTSGALSDSWSIVRDGERLHAECFAIDDDIQAALDKPSVLNRNRAMATLRYIAPDAEERIEYVRALLAAAPEENGIVAGASAWRGMMLVRFVAPDGYRLIREIARVLGDFRRKALPRVWMT